MEMGFSRIKPALTFLLPPWAITSLYNMADFNRDSIKDLYLGRFQQNDAVFFANPSLSVSENTLEKEIIIHPNPTNDNIIITNKSFTKVKTVAVTDTGGKLIKDLNWIDGNDELLISLRSLPSGVYFINLNSDKEKIVKTVIKN